MIPEKTAIETIVDYYDATRQVGHTNAMMFGAANHVDDPPVLVIADSANHADQLKNQYHVETLGRGNNLVKRLQGRRQPLLVDHYALAQMVRELRRQAMREALTRHSWMRDGVSYVGNGTFTLKQAEKLLDEDLAKGGML